ALPGQLARVEAAVGVLGRGDLRDGGREDRVAELDHFGGGAVRVAPEAVPVLQRLQLGERVVALAAARVELDRAQHAAADVRVQRAFGDAAELRCLLGAQVVPRRRVHGYRF